MGTGDVVPARHVYLAWMPDDRPRLSPALRSRIASADTVPLVTADTAFLTLSQVERRFRQMWL